MNALHEDVLQQLADNNAEILSQRGDLLDGFHFDYRINRSAGWLTISPIAVDTRNQRRLPQGMETVTVKIEETEKWFPNSAAMIGASLPNSARK